MDYPPITPVPAIITDRDKRGICDYLRTKGINIDPKKIEPKMDKWREADVHVAKRPHLLSGEGNDFEFSNIKLHFIIDGPK